jgi:nitroimidazol reductase NimA-like FMN-containing flavoprotein (pyridoxamine 5'-phosphate oxidase superfamily)
MNINGVSMMRRKDREVLDDRKIDEIINQSKICRIGFIDAGEVYIVPLNYGYVYENGKRVLYFHSAKEGRKIDLVKLNPTVGFELDTGFELWEADTACDYSAGYQSVIGNGVISIVDDFKEKKSALTKLMATNTGKTEWSFTPGRIDSVAVFKLEVTNISCKEHLR